MVRKIVKIDEEKCTGCGLCAEACHEHAIAMVDGKAKLIRDDYCDGLGDCLPACPADAIEIIEREAAAYDEEAVKAHLQSRQQPEKKSDSLPCGCPGSAARTFRRSPAPVQQAAENESQLTQWPVQIQLVSPRASYFQGANLLIAADCTAYAYGDFHNRFIRGRTVVVGCPKLDTVEYTEKLTAIIRDNDIKSVTIVRMEVPCCGGLENAAKRALQASGKFIPWQVVTISTDGRILE